MLRYFYLSLFIHVSFSVLYEDNRIRAERSLDVRKSTSDLDGSMVQLDMEDFMNDDDQDPQDYEPLDMNEDADESAQNEDYYEAPVNRLKNEDIDYSALLNHGDGTLTDESALGPRGASEAVGGGTGSGDQMKAKLVQSPVGKKCAFHNMKFPFFSHKTTPKKRKPVCMNCGKPYTNKGSPNDNVNKITQRMKKEYGNICPECIRKLLERFHRGKKPKAGDKKTKKIEEELEEVEDTKKDKADINKYFDYAYRLKRDENRDRQIKELAELEKKVDKVRVSTPSFTRPKVVKDFN